MSFWSTSNREEERAGRIRQDWEEVILTKSLCQSLEGLACDKRDVAAGNSKVVELTAGKAVQLIDGLTVTAPVAVVANDVHLSCSLQNSCGVLITRCDGHLGPMSHAQKCQCCIAAMQIVQRNIKLSQMRPRSATRVKDRLLKPVRG